jgi:hypothetical protein
VRQAFTSWFQALDADFFYADLQTLVSRETKFASVITTSRSDVCYPLPTYHVYIEVRMKCLSSWCLLRYFWCSFVQYIWNMSRVLTFLARSSAVPNFLKLHGTAYFSRFWLFLREAGIWVGLSTGQFCMFYPPSGSLEITVLSHYSTFVFYGQTTCSENVIFTCIMNRSDRSNITTFSCRQWITGLKTFMGSRTFWQAQLQIRSRLGAGRNRCSALAR